ncbi:MAG: hypothetical protein AB8E82_19365 [Aureispira sp.]
MEQETLPPIYRKMLFWQRFVWLVLVITLLVYAVRVMGDYGNFASNNSNFEFKYALLWLMEAATWVVLLWFVINLKKSINIGQNYEAIRSSTELANWMLRMHETAKSLLVVLVFLVIKSLFSQLFWTGIIL